MFTVFRSLRYFGDSAVSCGLVCVSAFKSWRRYLSALFKGLVEGCSLKGSTQAMV